MKLVDIYVLQDPRPGVTKCYIGKSVNAELRFKDHVKNSPKDRSLRKNWIRSLNSKSLQPELWILDRVDESEWPFWERHYISLFKSWNLELVNGTDGGDSGCINYGSKIRTEEHCKSLSAALKGLKRPYKPRKPISKEHIAKMRAGRKGNQYTLNK